MASLTQPQGPSPSGGQVEVISAKEFDNELEFQAQVCDRLSEITSYREVVYTDVRCEWAATVIQLVNERFEGHSRKHFNSKTNVLWLRVMPQEIHDCHQKWWHDEQLHLQLQGHLTTAEILHLWPGVGTTHAFIQGPYLGSRKEPDFFVRSDDLRLPNFVIETGWSESWDRLLDDMNLWLVGGNGDVRAVLLLKWQRVGTTPAVKGFAELYGLDRNDVPDLLQSENAQSTQPQKILLTRRMLFGNAALSTRNAKDVLALDLDRLRVIARRALTFMGLVPA